MSSDVQVEQLVIYVGTQAQIEAEKEAGRITDDDFVVVTDAPALQPLLTAQNAGTGIAITTEGGIVKISNTQTSAIWGNIEGDIANQYDLQQALSGKQPVIVDLDTIRSGAALGATALQVDDIINAVNSTVTDKPLAAAIGKILQDQVDNLKSRGRFLSTWNCATGLPATNPEESPYNYRAGDYYIVGNVGTGTKYRPDGTSYTEGVASTTVETREVNKDDTYLYDGVSWILQSNTQKSVTFANLAGDPYDNTDLAAALNAKQNELTQGTGITITGTTISNAGVRSVSSGATNGTISVNTNGTSEEVSVHGLGTAAFTSTTDYATAAQGTKADSAVQDVQINGIDLTIDVNKKVNIPKAVSGQETLGVVKAKDAGYGVTVRSDGQLTTNPGDWAKYNNATTAPNYWLPIVAKDLLLGMKAFLGTTITSSVSNLTWNDTEKASARNTLDIPDKTIFRDYE